ncbi:MAG: PH domain-containing protein [Micropruina sp.]
MDALFAPPQENWQRLSPRYATVRRVGSLVTAAIAFGFLAAVVGLLTENWWWAGLVAVAGVAFCAWSWWRIGRWVRSWGYAERADDLYVTHGVMFRSLTVVPYGRMQVVKVEAGPIERSLGLASVHLITASIQTNARIPGLPEAEAARLRDRLTEVGQARGAGV